MDCRLCRNPIDDGERWDGPLDRAMIEIAVAQVADFRPTAAICRECGETIRYLADRRRDRESLRPGPSS